MTKETKRERFVRLAEKRVDSVNDRLRVLGGCANPLLYEYTQTDIEKIRKAIEEEFSKMIMKFSDKPEVFSLEHADDGADIDEPLGNGGY